MFDPWGREDSLEKQMIIQESHGQRSLPGFTVHGVAKSRT